jgi:hypothetical protein
MTAKETVLEHAPDWSEEQAQRALLAAEGGRAEWQGDKVDRRREVRKRASAFRARQPEVTDVAALAREAREELEQRGS